MATFSGSSVPVLLCFFLKWMHIVTFQQTYSTYRLGSCLILSLVSCQLSPALSLKQDSFHLALDLGSHASPFLLQHCLEQVISQRNL